jgi:hypothetical protein
VWFFHFTPLTIIQDVRAEFVTKRACAWLPTKAETDREACGGSLQ